MDVDRRTSLGMIGMAATVTVGKPALAMPRIGDPVAGILFDGRFAEARRFASAWAGRGALTIDVARQDIGHTWRGALAGRSGPIAGATLYADHVISLGMGRERGLRQVAVQSELIGEVGPRLFRWVLA